jgi:hypothetical protein
MRIRGWRRTDASRSVVLPDCLGPVSTTTGKSATACRRVGSKALAMKPGFPLWGLILAIMHFKCKIASTITEMESVEVRVRRRIKKETQATTL